MSSLSTILKEPAAEETLRDVFRCFICMEKLCEAHLCPHCSKLCCYMCINKWLTEQRRQCPHCRKQLNVSDLVNCRWFEEVAVQVESLQKICSTIQTTAAAADDAHSARQQDLCRVHQEKFSVYCFTCNFSICHQCALWGGANGSHTGHTFKKLGQVYENHVARVRGEAAQLKQRLQELSKLVDAVELNVVVVRDAKEERVHEMRNAFSTMFGKLDAQLKVKLMTLMRHKRLLLKETEQLAKLVDDVDHQIETSSQSQLVSKAPELLKMLMQAEVKSRNHCNATLPNVPPDFASELVPQFDTCTFLIEKFTRLQTEGLAIYSKPLTNNGLCWRLKVYPCGNGPARGEYLSVFLELSGGHPGNNKYEYRVQMLHEMANKEISREFSSVFEVGECWGYTRFFPLDLLATEGYLDVPGDTLQLRFQVRPSTYFQRCRDQQWYIHELMKTNQQQSTEIADLREQLDRERQLNLLMQREASGVARKANGADLLDSSTKEQKSEVNEKIFSEILKCLSSPCITSKANTDTKTLLLPTVDQEIENKNGSGDVDSTADSDEEGAVGGAGSPDVEDMHKLDLMLQGSSGSDTEDGHGDEEDNPSQRENLVEYSEMLVPAIHGEIVGTSDDSGDLEHLLSLSRIFGSSPTTFPHRLNSASVLETLQEPPRLSSSVTCLSVNFGASRSQDSDRFSKKLSSRR